MKFRSDSGVTLIELLITLAILGILGAVLTEAMMIGLRTTESTNERLVESVDAQLVSSYFVNDVQSADKVSLTDVSCGGDPGAAPLNYPVVTMNWKDLTAPSGLNDLGECAGPSCVQHTASYVVQKSGDDRRLIRRHCQNGSVVSTQPVAQHLASSPPASISCDVDPCPETPQKVTINLTVNYKDADLYPFQLSAVRRPS